MNAYADTSFLVSIYIPDVHSSEADARVAQSAGILLTLLHPAELAHAVEQNIFRNRISRADAVEIYRNFDRDCRTGLWIVREFPELAFQTCVALARAHVAALGSRTLDTLHVACALELHAERFWTFDERQAKLAKAGGLRIT